MKMKINNTQNICLEFSNAGGESIFPTAPQLLKSTFSQKIENNLIINTESRLVLLGATGGVTSEVVPISTNGSLMSTPNPSIMIDRESGMFYLGAPGEVESQINQNSEDLENISTLLKETELTGKTPENTAETA